MRGFQKKVIAITGAGGGIGSALAREFANTGAHLALSDINTDAISTLADELRKTGTEVSTVALDVRNHEAFCDWANTIVKEFGQVDVLINNAGVTSWGTFEHQTIQDVRWLLDINLGGVMNGCNAFLPHLRAVGGGHIVNISSMAALMAIPMQSTYAASKWAVRGFSRCLRIELGPRNIGVTAILPGTIATPFLKRARTDDSRGTNRMAELMMRFGTSPECVARAVARSIQRNRGETFVGWDSRLVALFERFLPGLVSFIINGLYPRLAPKGKLQVDRDTGKSLPSENK